MIGGPSKKTEPSAIFLRNGDVLVMSQEARQSYHAVPKILRLLEVGADLDTDTDFVNSYMKNHRINMNVRQVF